MGKQMRIVGGVLMEISNDPLVKPVGCSPGEVNPFLSPGAHALG